MPDNFPDPAADERPASCRRSGTGCVGFAYTGDILDDRRVDAGHAGLCQEHIREMRQLISLRLGRASKHQ